MKFEWDERKAHANFIEHKVSFDEATSIFEDPLLLIFADPKHSADERRFILMGESNNGRLLVISFTSRSSSIRLISARKAIRAERKFYEEDN